MLSQVPVARGQAYGPGVYLSEDPEFAMGYVHGQQRLLFASCLLRDSDRRVARGTQGSTYNIVVAAQKERVLPKYVVYFQPRHIGAGRSSTFAFQSSGPQSAALYNPFPAAGGAAGGAANPFLGGGFRMGGAAPVFAAGGFNLGSAASVGGSQGGSASTLAPVAGGFTVGGVAPVFGAFQSQPQQPAPAGAAGAPTFVFGPPGSVPPLVFPSASVSVPPVPAAVLPRGAF
jgi:hypothetical protein